MKRLFAMLTLVAILLTGCAVPTWDPNDQTTNIQQVDSSVTDSGEFKQERPDRTKKEDEPEDIARFELNDTFQNLLDDVNAEHEAVKLYTDESEQYLVQNVEPGFNGHNYYWLPEMMTSSKRLTDNTLTLEQVTEDMDIYYKLLRTNYGLYTYFGGDEVFRPAIDAVIADCAAMESITCGALQESIIVHFSFIKDVHFGVNGEKVGDHEFIVPFYFRNVDYVKTKNGYETRDGRVVASVDGYEDLDELFKRSLTLDGDLVYYPILLGTSEHYLGVGTCSTPTLTVRYTDSSTDELTTEVFYTRGATYLESGTVDIQEENGIPVITPQHFWSDSDGLKFVESGNTYSDRDIVIMDLRPCYGGAASIIQNWTTNYTKSTVWPHALAWGQSMGFDPLYKYAVKHMDEEFVPMDNVLIMLSSKATASGGEMMVDMGHNMENTLIIGDNTVGCLIGSGYHTIQLPNSGLSMTFGQLIYLHPEGHFEEYQGYFPDIWVPAGEAKEAVMNFIAKNTTVTYEQIEK